MGAVSGLELDLPLPGASGPELGEFQSVALTPSLIQTLRGAPSSRNPQVGGFFSTSFLDVEILTDSSMLSAW